MGEQTPPAQQAGYPYYPQAPGVPPAQGHPVPVAPANTNNVNQSNNQTTQVIIHTPQAGLSLTPYAGVRIISPRIAPLPGQVILGYELCYKDVGCCRCTTLSPEGFLAVILLAILFWPLAFIPCMMDSCHSATQCAVYGFPGSAPQNGPTAAVVNGGSAHPAPAHPQYSGPVLTPQYSGQMTQPKYSGQA